MQTLHLFTSDVRGDRRNTVYSHAVEINTLAQLQQAARYDHVGAAFKDNRRSNEGFLWADCLIADVDNAAGDVVEPAQIADDLPDVQHYVLYSCHHLLAKGTAPAVPRFHVIFPIERTESREQLEGLKRALCSHFPYYDAACVDGARFFFGVQQPQGEAVDGLFTLDEMLDPETEAPPEEHAAASVEVIPQGRRNDTLSAYALKVLKAKGADDGTARQLFKTKAAQCVPPLDDDELEALWRAAVRAYKAKVASRADYLSPTAYALQGLKSGSSSDNNKLHPSDYSNLAQARLFVQMNEGEVLYNAGLGWLVWDSSRFAADEAAAHRRYHDLTDAQLLLVREEEKSAAVAGVDEGSSAKAKQDATKAYAKFVVAQRSGAAIRAVLGEAQHLCDVQVDALDSDAFLLNCPTCAVDLKTGQRKPNAPAAKCTKACGVDPGTEGAALWQTFVQRFTCGDEALADYLQMVAGAAAVGHVYQEQLIVAYGSGGNGKSTFFNLLARVLGSYAGTLSADALTVNPNRNKLPELAELRGKRLVLAAELEEGVRLDVSMLKRLCSTDALHVEPKYKQPFEFIPSHTCVLFTNFLPKVGSSDEGTWSRLVVVPCRAKFRNEKGEIKDMAGHLFDHAGGTVLSWIIEGARRFIAADFKLDPPPCVRAAVEQYRQENDWLAHFLEDCCEVGPNFSAPGGVLAATYREWSKRTGEFPRRNDELKAALEGVGIRWKKTKQGAIYNGLQLRPDWF